MNAIRIFVTGASGFIGSNLVDRLLAQGKDVVELQIGDSPFASTRHAVAAGIRAIEGGPTHYCPSPGLPSFREAANDAGVDGRSHRRVRSP